MARSQTDERSNDLTDHWKPPLWSERNFTNCQLPHTLRPARRLARAGVVDQLVVSELSGAPKPRTGRVVIEDIRPRTPNGFPPKRWWAARCGSPPTSSGKATTSWPPGPGGARRRGDGQGQMAGRPWWRWATTASRRSSSPGRSAPHEFVVEGWTDRLATWRHDVTVKLTAGQDVAVELEEGARLLEDVASRVDKADRPRVKAAADALRDASLRSRPAGPRLRRRAGRPSWPTCPTPTARPPSRCRSGSTASGPPSAPGTSCSPAPTGAASRAPPSGSRPSPPWASTSSTCRPSTPSARASARAEQHARPPGPTTRAARGRSARRRAATPRSTPSSAPSTTSTPSSPRPGRSAWRWPSTTPCSARPITRGSKEHPEWFHHRPDGTIKYAENPPKKYQDIYPINFWPDRRRRPAARCGTRARTSSTSGSATACGSSGSTTPTPSRSRSGSGSSARCRPNIPTSSSWPRPSPGRR